MSDAITTTDLPGLTLLHRGKVRDVWRVDAAHLLLVATDRISAFDRILGTPVAGKGAALTQTSAFWFRTLGLESHFVSEKAWDMPPAVAAHARRLGGRATLVREVAIVPVECVVRGHLAGSVEAAYRKDGAIQGVALPPGIPLGGAFPAPIFTPTTKAAQGHDQPLTYAELEAQVGFALAAQLRDRSLEAFALASKRCAAAGLVLCDTKFELGHDAGGRLVLADEALTPDSSRFFLASEHRPGERPPVAWDKQVVRDYLKTLPAGSMEAPDAPTLPAAVVAATLERYRAVYRKLAGRDVEAAVAEAVA